MHVLIATKETQGRRKNDFSFAEDGEHVTFGSECDREPVDGKCGCRRAMSGVKTHRATTTVKVVDEKTTVTALTAEYAESLVNAGWYKTVAEATPAAQRALKEIVRLAAYFPAGTVLEKRGDRFGARLPKANKLH